MLTIQKSFKNMYILEYAFSQKKQTPQLLNFPGLLLGPNLVFHLEKAILLMYQAVTVIIYCVNDTHY